MQGWLTTFLNPFSSVWANVKAAKEADVMDKANLIGEGTHLGGLLVVRKGGDVQFQYQVRPISASSASVVCHLSERAACRCGLPRTLLGRLLPGPREATDCGH